MLDQVTYAVIGREAAAGAAAEEVRSKDRTSDESAAYRERLALVVK
jgi:hypothetical protein